MKIIHTYLPTENGTSIDKLYIYTITLSVLLAKKHYDHVVLYTNEEFADIVRGIGLPYDEINTSILEGLEYKTFSIPKMLVYQVQEEPFIHIDLDTLLFKKYDFTDIESIYCSFPENFEQISLKDKNDFYYTYIQPTLRIKQNLPEEFIKHISFKDVPNMSVLAVTDTNLMKNAVTYCLKIYEENRGYFDSNFYHACVIEQLFIPAALRMFKKQKNDGRDFLINFIHKKPQSIIFENDNFDFPFNITQENGWVHFNSKWEIFKHALYNFDGFLHLGGHKKIPKIAFLIKLRIMVEFEGYDYLRDINKFYKEFTECDELTESYFNNLKHTMSRMIEYKILNQKLL